MDPRLRRLLDPDGVPVALGARAFDTFLYLVEHSNQLIDKHTLMKAVWPTAVVEENNLNQSISAIRRALCEVPGEHRFIVTVPGRGFRFVPTVQRLDAPPSTAGVRRVDAKTGARPIAAWWVAIASITLMLGAWLLVSIPGAPHPTAQILRPKDSPVPAAASAAHPAVAAASIAVVPFAILTGESDKDYFSDGLAEELINELAHIPGLKVPARSSSFAYQGHNVDARQIGRDLGVATILEGSVVSAGERIRVQVQLVSAQSGFQLWSQTYDRKFGDGFELEDDICARIVQALRSTIAVPIPALAARTPPTLDPEAYRLYLQGLAARGPDADLFLQQSIARDPRFAPAYAALAEGHVAAAAFAAFGSTSDPNAMKRAEQEAQHALALDPSLAQAHNALGMLNAWRGDWRGAESSFESTQALGPSDPSPAAMHATYVLQTMGHMQEALRALETEYAGAPTNWELIATLSATYNLMGMEAQARHYADLSAALGGGNAKLLRVVKQWEAIRHAHYEDAAALAPSAQSFGEGSADGRATIIRQAYTALGQPAQRPAAAHALRALFEQLSRSKQVARYKEDFIILPVMLGDLDLAFDAANRSLDELARLGTVGLIWGVLWMPQMRVFRQDPRFQGRPLV